MIETESPMQEFKLLMERIYKRRIENKMPRKFFRHAFDGVSNELEILKIVDQCTSGQFAGLRMTYNGINSYVIGFAYESDLTMFLMTYAFANK